VGLLVLAHGAAESLDEVEAYYGHILHGRRPAPERLAGLRERYRAIGGRSPLNRLTCQQAAQIAAGLRAMGLPISAYVGFQHVSPFVGDAMQALVEDGRRHAVVLVMTPYYSPLGVGRYLAAVEEAARGTGGALRLRMVRSWYQEPEFLALLERRVRDALETLARRDPGPSHVIFTAHSLPVPPAPLDDPYVGQFTAAARLVADRLGLRCWSTCYQSASPTGQPWLGPDILEELDRVAALGARRVVVCPTSFAADNLEVLYDIGLEAAAHARRLGMAFVQTVPFNDDPAFTGFLARMLARHVRALISGLSPASGRGVAEGRGEGVQLPNVAGAR